MKTPNFTNHSKKNPITKLLVDCIALGFIIISHSVFAQEKTLHNDDTDKNNAKPHIIVVEYDYLTKAIYSRLAVKKGDFLIIKVKNLNTLLYEAKIEVKQGDLEIPKAFSNPITLFAPSAPNSPSSIVTNTNTPKPDTNVGKEEIKVQEKKVEELAKAIEENDSKKGDKKKDFKKLPGSENFENQEDFYKTRQIYRQRQQLFDSYYQSWDAVSINIDLLKSHLITLSNINDITEQVRSKAVLASSNSFKERNERILTTWKSLYPNVSINNFSEGIAGFRELINREIPNLIDAIKKQLKAPNYDPNVRLLLTAEKISKDSTEYTQYTESVIKDFENNKRIFLEQLLDLQRLEDFLEEKKNDETLFQFISEPIQVESKDCIDVIVSVSPRLSNFNLLRSNNRFDIPLPSLQNTQFPFRINTYGSIAFHFSTGFVFGLTPRNESFQPIPEVGKDTTTILKRIGSKGFPSSVALAGLVHISSRTSKEVRWALSTGISLSSDLSSLSAITGLGIILGRQERFIFTAGLLFKKVDTLKDRYRTNKVDNDFKIFNKDLPNDQSNLYEQKYKTGFGFAFTFNLNPTTRQ